MDADLVTVSGDMSGVNALNPGDELVGLTRAFIYAGTPSVVVSLWDVEIISTELLLVHFYERLKHGDTKIEAIQNAQLYIKNLTAREAMAYYDIKLSIEELKLNTNEEKDRIRESKREILAKLLAAEESLGHPVGLDYQIFSHPFFWAPFILVGDWM